MQWFNLILIFISFNAFAVSDSFLLAEIVVNTARELEELEELIAKTQKHTEKLSQFADTIDDYSYRAQRLKTWAEDIKALSDENPKDLAEINSLLRQIRMIEEDTKRIYMDYSRREFENKHEIRKYQKISKNQQRNTRKYRSQALRKQRNSADSMQQVAQNTATMAYEQSKTNQMMAEQNIKISKIYDVVLEKEKRILEKETRIKNKYQEAKK